MYIYIYISVHRDHTYVQYIYIYINPKCLGNKYIQKFFFFCNYKYKKLFKKLFCSGFLHSCPSKHNGRNTHLMVVHVTEPTWW